MRELLKALLCLLISLCPAGTMYAQCDNGNIEDGNFTNWSGWTSENHTGTIDISGSVPGIVAGRHNIVSTGFDPIVGGNIMPTAFEGSKSIRLGSSAAQNQWKAQTIAYTFTVTSANAHSSFAYALVLQDPIFNHQPQEKPFFQWWLSKSGDLGNSQSLANLITLSQPVFADVNNPFFTQHPNFNTNAIIYKNWQTVCLPDLTPYIGKKITIYFHTAGCTQGQHYGYAYIDGLCQPNYAQAYMVSSPPYYNTCPTQLICNGSTSLNVTDHYWKIEKIDCNTGTTIPGTERTQYNYNAPVGIVDAMSIYRNLGGLWSSGCWRITLGVRSCSSTWATTITIVNITIPEIQVSNIYKCCDDQNGVNLVAYAYGASTKDAGTFSWYDEAGNFLGNGTTIAHQNSEPPYFVFENKQYVSNPGNARYRVVYTDKNGCVNEGWIYVINKPNDMIAFIGTNFCYNSCLQPTTLTASSFKYDFCRGSGADFSGQPYVGLATDPSLLTFQWSTGETTPTINVHPGITNYSVTISNGCFSKTFTKDISALHPFAGNFPNVTNVTPVPAGDIWYSSTMHPGSSSLRFYESGLTIGNAPAYRSTQYELWIFDRDGQEVYNHTENAPCEGFYNGDIFWDGRRDDGTLVNEMGDYGWILYLRNCNGTTNAGNEHVYSGTVQVLF